MMRLAITALFGWAAYRIMEENRPAPMLLAPPDDDAEDSGTSDEARPRKQRRRAG